MAASGCWPGVLLVRMIFCWRAPLFVSSNIYHFDAALRWSIAPPTSEFRRSSLPGKQRWARYCLMQYGVVLDTLGISVQTSSSTSSKQTRQIPQNPNWSSTANDFLLQLKFEQSKFAAQSATTRFHFCWNSPYSCISFLWKGYKALFIL
jgi:hypothetical protein